MSGQMSQPGPAGMLPVGFNPYGVPGQGAPLPNSMAPALPAALAQQTGNPQAGQMATQSLVAPSPIAAQLQTQPAPQAAPAPGAPAPAAQAAPGAPPAANQPAPPKLPATPFTPYAANIAHYESGGGTMAGNGGGAFQFEPEESAAFEKANPQFAGQDKSSMAYQGAAYSWLTQQNAAQAKTAGVDATAPGVNYAAFALGAPTAIALAKAPDPTADATSFVAKLPNGPAIIKGNPALFANHATIDDVFQRAQAVQTTGSLPNAAQTTSAAPAAALGAPGAQPGSSNTPDQSSNLAALLSKLPNAPTLTPAKSNPWEAFASGMLGSHGLAQGLGAGFAGVNAAKQGNQQSANDTALAQQNAALQTGQAKIELGKLAAFQPVLGATSVINGQDVMMWRNGLGEVQYKTMDGQLVKQSMQDNTITAANSRATQRLTNQDNLAAAGTNAAGAPNPQTPPANPGPAPLGASPLMAPPPSIPGTNIPPQMAPQGPPPSAPQAPQGPAPAAPAAQPNADPVVAAAAPLVQSLDAQAATYKGPVASIAKAYVTANQTAYVATQKAAVEATDANVAATKAAQAIAADPSAFPQSSAWGNFNNMITSKLGYSPFSGASNGNLQLSQAFIKQASAGGIGDMLHNAMGISRPSQMEVQMVQHAVANGVMPISTLNALLQSGINNNNSAIAEGQIAQQVWANGKYAAMPGSFTTAMTTAQSNLENGKYPALYKPMVQLAPVNAAPGGAPAPQPSQQSAAAPVVLQADDTRGYAALPSGAQYVVNGNIFVKK